MARIAIIAIVLTLVPLPAWANAGIGYFLLALPFVVVSLPPAILLEACVLAPLLQIPAKRALLLSFGANWRSTLWGLGLGIAADIVLLSASDSAGPAPTSVAATIMLVPLFFLTWWIEYRVIMRKATDVSQARIAAGTGAANLLSYAAMVAFVWMALPGRDPMAARVRVSEAISLGSALKTPVEEFWAQHKRFPAEIPELGESITTSKVVAAIELRRNGVIAVILNKNEFFPDGGEITFTAAEDANAKTLSWQCRSTLPPRFLSAGCRE